MLGELNTRLKDFYDIWALVSSYEFDKDRLALAIAATFERRKTEIPAAPPYALTSAFAEDPAKQKQWEAFIANVAGSPGSLTNVIGEIAGFLMDGATRARARR